MEKTTFAREGIDEAEKELLEANGKLAVEAEGAKAGEKKS